MAEPPLTLNCRHCHKRDVPEDEAIRTAEGIVCQSCHAFQRALNPNDRRFLKSLRIDSTH